LPKCSALLADLESLGLDSAMTAPELGDDDGQPPAVLDAEAPEGDALELLSAIDPDRLVYLESVAEWIDGLDPAEYAEVRADIDPEILAALGVADNDELEALGLPLDYAGELPGTLDEMAEGAAWSTARKVIVLGAIVTVAGAAGWWFWKRHHAKTGAPRRPVEAPRDVDPAREPMYPAPDMPPAPRPRMAAGLADFGTPIPRPWST
jgi:hypothetical protein